MLRWFELRRLGPVGAAVAVAFLGLGIVTTQSRAGGLAVAISVFWLVLVSRRWGLRTRAAALISGLAVFGIAVLSWDAVNDALSLWGRATAIAAGPRNSSLALDAIWDAVWRQPWLGLWMDASNAGTASCRTGPSLHRRAAHEQPQPGARSDRMERRAARAADHRHAARGGWCVS